ncbi:MAG: peptidoglycan D,D-transpeptidase FtsI family protein [Chloroflexia bacterium]
MLEFTLQARRRTLAVIVLLSLLALALFGRLLDLQIVHQAEMAAWAEEEIQKSERFLLRARRGHIFDTQGRPLALSEKSYALWVDGSIFDGTPAAKAEVGRLCTAQDRDVLAQLMAGQATGTYRCAYFLDPARIESLEQAVQNGELAGVTLLVEPKRYYPYGEILSPVLGCLQRTDDPRSNLSGEFHGAWGIEASCDRWLYGTDGWVSKERDPQGNPIPIGTYEEQPPVDGADVTLTLDLDIQYMAYRRLVEAVQRWEARRGDIIVLDPRSGAILALAAYPSVDTNRLDECTTEACRALLFSTTPATLYYEPGSTMKVPTLAIALEEHVVGPDTVLTYTTTTLYDVPVNNWNYQFYPEESLTDILLHSSNIGAAHVGVRIPPVLYYRYLERLGLGRPTGVELPGEEERPFRRPDVPGSGWTRSDQVANSYGQGIAVTPLQLASAIGAVANGGNLMQPYIIQAIGRNGVITPTVPVLREHIFHPETCRHVTEMMVAVGDTRGQDGGPLIPGYRVAVKTGTAKIPDLVYGGYEENRTIASTVLYAPADDPRFLILVRIEGDRPVVLWGEEAALPVAAGLAEFLITYLHIPPSTVESGIP